MFELTSQNHADLAELNSTYSTRHRGVQIIGDIVCQVTKKIYASAEGATETLAVQAAIEIAKTATRPNAFGEDHAAEELRAERDRLVKELAELKAEKGESVSPTPPGDKADREVLKATLDEADVKYTRGAHIGTLRRLVAELEAQGAAA